MHSRAAGAINRSTVSAISNRWYSTHHNNSKDIEKLLKKSNSNAKRAKQQQFVRPQSSDLLLNKNFFTAHVLPSRVSKQGPVTKEYAFLLPNGTAIYQSQPTTGIEPYHEDPQWTQLIPQYEHLGWQVMGRSGKFLVLQRQKNSRQDSIGRVKVSVKKYGTMLIVLTTGIFMGGWYYGM